MHHERDKEHADGSTDHAERDKARLDKVLGVTCGDNGTHHEARDGKREVVLHRGDGLRTGHVLEQERKDLRHGPEHRKRNDGRAQSAVTPAEAQAAAGHGELHLLLVVLDLRDEEARDRAEHAHAGQYPRDDDGLRKQEPDGLVTDEGFQVDEVDAHDGKPCRRDHADKRKNLQEGVRVAQVMHAEHFADNGILGRTVNCKPGCQTDRKPEGHSRAVASHEHRLRNHESGHEQRRPRQHLVFRKPVGKEPSKPDHHHVRGDKEHLQHERLPNLAAIRTGK